MGKTLIKNHEVLFGFLAFIVCVLLSACTKEPLYLELDRNVVNAETAGGSYSMNISSNSSWTAYCEDSWVYLDMASGKGSEMFSFQVEENLLAVNRETDIYFNWGNGESTTLSVKQTGAEAYLDVSTEYVYVKAEEDYYFAIGVDANQPFVWSVNRDWLTLKDDVSISGSPYGRALSFNTKKNLTPYRDTAILSIKTDMYERVVLIYRLAVKPNLSASPLEISADHLGGKYEVAVECNARWRAESSADWIKLSQSAEMGSGTLEIVVSENKTAADNTATVMLSTDVGLSQRIPVTRKGIPVTLEVDCSEITVKPVASTFTVNVSSDTDWIISSSLEQDEPSWFSVSINGVNTSKGSKNAEVVFSFSENKTSAQRKAEVYFDVSCSGKKQTLTIIQNGSQLPDYETEIW